MPARLIVTFILVLALDFSALAEIRRPSINDCVNPGLPRDLLDLEITGEIQDRVEDLKQQLTSRGRSFYESKFGKPDNAPPLNYSESCIFPLIGGISGLGLQSDKLEYFHLNDNIIVARWEAYYPMAAKTSEQTQVYFGVFFSKDSFASAPSSPQELAKRVSEEVESLKVISNLIKEN